MKDTKASATLQSNFIVTQCYYELPTSANSIVLTLTENNPDDKGQGLRRFWKETYGKGEEKGESESEKKRAQEKEPGSRRQAEEEDESAPMERVRGLGDEAFWSATRIGGALYVLKADRYFRISVGGAGDAAAKLKKSKTLIQKALQRLQ